MALTHRPRVKSKERAPIISLDSTSISLSGMHLGDIVLLKLFDSLHVNITVTELDASYCDMTDEACESLGKLIKVNRTITCLTLVGNHLTDAAIGWLSRCMRQPNTISSLNLSTNPFGDLGVVDLGRMLERNSTLRELVLLDVRMTCAGAVNFAETLLLNETLLFLTLPFHVGCDLITQVQRILRRNWTSAHGGQDGSSTHRTPIKSMGWSALPKGTFPQAPDPRRSKIVHHKLGRDTAVTATMVCLALLDAKTGNIPSKRL